jgi:hypothetical protein
MEGRSAILMRMIALIGVLMFGGYAMAEDAREIQGVEGLAALEEAGITSRLEFRNAEVIVKYQSESAPTDVAKAEQATKVEIVMRLTVDYANQRCFCIKRLKRLDDRAPKEPELAYVIYRDGKGSSSIDLADPQQASREGFFAYIGERDIWRVELGGLGHAPIISFITPEAFCDAELNTLRSSNPAKSSNVRTLTRAFANGNKEYVIEWPSSGSRTVKTYDPRYNLPIETSHTQIVNGAPEVVLHIKSILESIHGFARCKSSSSEHLLVLEGTDPRIHKATTDYQWLQFNEDDLQWPANEQQIIASDTNMQQYLNGGE